MEIDWLKDFLAVVERGSFSRAAKARDITQSALSRRIQFLENWLGSELFFRTTHKVTLSPAGKSFRFTAEDVIRRLESGRREALQQGNAAVEELYFASTNALALNFFPEWLRGVETLLPFAANIQSVANHWEGCERMMIQGQIQFLLGHHHPLLKTSLETGQFISHPVGADILMPVLAPALQGFMSGEGSLKFLGFKQSPIPYLSYRAESGLGRIVSAVQAMSPNKPWLKPTFNSNLVTLLVAMALDGRGMAWLPKSLISEYLADGRLVRADDSLWDIPVGIHLFRSKARLQNTAEQFWATVKTIQNQHKSDEGNLAKAGPAVLL